MWDSAVSVSCIIGRGVPDDGLDEALVAGLLDRVVVGGDAHEAEVGGALPGHLAALVREGDLLGRVHVAGVDLEDVEVGALALGRADEFEGPVDGERAVDVAAFFGEGTGVGLGGQESWP